MKRLAIILILMTFLPAACSSGSVEEDLSSSSDEATAVIQATESELMQPTQEPTSTVPIPSETDTPQPSAEAPTATSEAQIESAEAPTATALPLATEDPAALVISGQTEEGAFFLGNPDAAVTVIDYSDFL